MSYWSFPVERLGHGTAICRQSGAKLGVPQVWDDGNVIRLTAFQPCSRHTVSCLSPDGRTPVVATNWPSAVMSISVALVCRSRDFKTLSGFRFHNVSRRPTAHRTVRPSGPNFAVGNSGYVVTLFPSGAVNEWIRRTTGGDSARTGDGTPNAINEARTNSADLWARMCLRIIEATAFAFLCRTACNTDVGIVYFTACAIRQTMPTLLQRRRIILTTWSPQCAVATSLPFGSGCSKDKPSTRA